MYNAVGVPRAPREHVERLARWSPVSLAAHCDQVRAAGMSDDTLNALLLGIGRVAANRRKRQVAA